MQVLEAKCAIFFVLFTHNFHSHSSTVRFTHSYSWQKFSYSIWLVLSHPRHKTRDEKNFKFSHLSQEKREWEENDGGDEVRLYWNWIESAEFCASYWEFFFCLWITVCARSKKVYPFFLFRSYFLNQCRSSAAIINIWCENFPFRRLISHSNSFSTIEGSWRCGVEGSRRRKVVELFLRKEKAETCHIINGMEIEINGKSL